MAHLKMAASFTDTIRDAILAKIPDAAVTVTGGGGHFSIEVVAPSFGDQGTLARQRAVYAAITHLMSGDAAPLHAVDSLVTRNR
jgi:acid stress-induced BolA-like protein IbaG/YrbA